MIKKITMSIVLSFVIPLAHTVSATPLTITEKWQTHAELKQPESVAYDNAKHGFYVSNINGGPSDKDGNGFISYVTSNGSINKLKWVDGLNAPKGMAILDKTLFVADIDELILINIDTANITQRIKLEGQHFLNDVAISKSGGVYITDTFTNRIYHLNRNKLEVWLEDEQLANPNGLYIDNEQLIVGSWGKPTDGWKTDIPGHILLISPRDKKITDFANGSPIGNLDGLVKQNDTTFLVTDWMQGKLMQASNDGQVKTLLELGQGTADMAYLKKQNLIVIPHMMKGKLMAYSIK